MTPIFEWYVIPCASNRKNQPLSYKWTIWTWERTGWSSRPQENHRLFYRKHVEYTSNCWKKTERSQHVTGLTLKTLGSQPIVPKNDSKDKHQKHMCVKEIRLLCSKCVNHSKLNSQCNWGDLHDHLMSTDTFTSTMIKIIIQSSEIYEESGLRPWFGSSNTFLH